MEAVRLFVLEQVCCVPFFIGGAAHDIFETIYLVRNPLPGCLIQVVRGVRKNTPHPPEDKWFVKKLYEE